ncbi:MAG TPA: hypothetical protein VFN97_23590 [Actinospica sp.]|nr:hypothetical protein [Actinospica sp.]
MEAQVESGRSVSWAAILLPLLAVAGAVGCFAAGLQANGTGHEPMVSYVLPLVISPVVAALIAIAAAMVHGRTKIYLLAAGYALVVVSLVLGLLAARSGT